MICTIFHAEKNDDDDDNDSNVVDDDAVNNKNGRAAPASQALNSKSKLAHRSVICCIVFGLFLSFIACVFTFSFYSLPSNASVFARVANEKS